MKKDQNIQEELKIIAPTLAKIKKSQPYKVPDTYFIQLSQKVHSRMLETKNQSSIISILINHFLSRKYLYGSFAIIILGGFLYINTFIEKPISNKMSIDNISIEDAQRYIAGNIDDYEEDMLFEYFDIDDSELLSYIDMEGSLDNEYLEDNILNTFNEQTLKEELL